MSSPASKFAARVLTLLIVLMCAACSGLPWEQNGGLAVGSSAERDGIPMPPLSTTLYIDIPDSAEVLGRLQVIQSRSENTFASIAREYGLGYDELKIANPHVDPWLPGDGTRVYLPTMMVLPTANREGVVVNLPAMRLLHFQPSAITNSLQTIENYPIGIGREGWATPTGQFHITEKVTDPNWYPPESVRKEHAELGDPLPRIVPPGPDNPLGRYKMRLSDPEYLIHGTNKPSGVGMRVSHGCIRLYPENIAELFQNTATKTKVQIINQPVLVGWHQQNLYLEVHPLLAEDRRDLQVLAQEKITNALKNAPSTVKVNQALVASIVNEQRGMPFPITSSLADVEAYLTKARLSENILSTPAPPKTASR